MRYIQACLFYDAIYLPYELSHGLSLSNYGLSLKNVLTY